MDPIGEFIAGAVILARRINYQNRRTMTSEPTLTVNGKVVPLSEARKILEVPEEDCLGCLLDYAEPKMHDRPDTCLVASGDVVFKER